ncbi:MAG: TRAP transporter substrate-binding protein [Candidatus Rokubacteria bacterium]|nr:TRAP transporter substrate-binding protein [Candidatus Rokubacteria bacterium]
MRVGARPRLMAAAVATVALAASASAATRPLVVGTAMPAKHEATLAAQQFAEKLAESAAGIKVEHHHSGSLGSERDLLRAVQAGSLDLTPLPTAALAALVPELGVFQLPYLFRDYPHLFAALDGDVVRPHYATLLERKGLRFVAFFVAGYRALYGTITVSTPEELRGKPIRVQDDRATIATFAALGMIPLPIPVPEVTTAFRSATVALAEGGLPTYQRARQFEVAKYVADLRHVHEVVVFVMAKSSWARLDAAGRRAVTEAARLAEQGNRQLVAEQDRSIQDQLRAKGAVINTPDPAPFRAAVRGLWEELFATPAGRDARRIVDHVLALATSAGAGVRP